MGNNLVHINGENYLASNRINLILIREEVFLNLYYEENKIKNVFNIKIIIYIINKNNFNY